MMNIRPGRLLCGLNKSFVAIALVLTQFACSTDQKPALQYNPESNINPSGPAVPNNDSLAPANPNNPANWYANGDLESGLAPWYAQGEGASISRSSEQKHNGDYSLLIQGRSAAWHAPVMPLLRSLPAGDYEASVWVRMAAGSAATPLSLSLKTDPADADAAYASVAQAEVTADGWTRLYGTFTHAPQGTLEDLTLYVESADAAASYYLDDFVLNSLSNLVVNGGLETGLNPWRSQGGGVLISRVSEQVHSGDYSLLVTGRSDTWHAPVMDLPLLATGRSYQASVWVRLTAGTPAGSLGFTLKRTVGGQSEYLPLAQGPVTPDGWVQLAGVFSHPVPDGTLEELFLYVEAADVSASFYVDDLEVTVASQNLVINGDLESSLSGWAPFGSNVQLTRTHEDAHSGEYSLHVSNRDQSWQGASFGFAPLTQGELYQFSCWAKMAPANPDADLALTIKIVDDGGENYLTISSLPATAATWVQLSGPYQHAPVGELVELTAYLQASVATAEFRVDDCAVTLQ